MSDQRLQVFISHSIADEYVARLVKRWIEEQLPGVLAFVASEDLRGGEMWPAVLRRRIPLAKAILTLLSPRSIDSHWVLFESGAGFLTDRVIPLCIDGLTRDTLVGPFSLLHARDLNPFDLQRIVADLEARTGLVALHDSYAIGRTFSLVQEIEDYLFRRQITLAGIDGLFVAYRLADLPAPSRSIYEEEPQAIASLIRRVVEVEEPVHRDIVLRRIRGRYGLKRSGAAVQGRFQEILEGCLQAGAVEWDRDKTSEQPHPPFLCVTRDMAVIPRRPAGGPDSPSWRSIKEISNREIQAGLIKVKQELTLSSHDEIVREAARQFGFSKMTAPVRQRFEEVAATLGRSGLLGDLHGWRALPRRRG